MNSKKEEEGEEAAKERAQLRHKRSSPTAFPKKSSPTKTPTNPHTTHRIEGGRSNVRAPLLRFPRSFAHSTTNGRQRYIGVSATGSLHTVAPSSVADGDF